MWLDAQSLEDFYQTPWGEQVCATVSDALESLWPKDEFPSDSRLLGMGYALPFLDLWAAKAQSCLAFMPRRLGVTHWPERAFDPNTPAARKNRINLTAHVQSDMMPLADRSIDRILVTHSFEFANNLQAQCDELYRVLDDQGSVLMVLPNRAGLWSRSERSPFGYGVPFTPGQITGVLRTSGFEISKLHGALFYPPRPNRFVIKHAGKLEKVGGNWAKLMAGVLIVHARKQNPPIKFSRGKRDAMQPLKDLLAGINTGPAPVLQPVPIPKRTD